MTVSNEMDGVAVIGMAGRFPKARNLTEYWRNLVEGVECLSFLSDQELIESGISAGEMSHPGYVKAGCFLDDADLFDAAFFGISPKEAELMDPQHRILLEVAWEALENSGYSPDSYDGEIGVFSGCTMSTYMLYNLNPEVGRSQSLSMVLGNDKDYLSTRISYKLNLKGPSLCVQTACSTSLVAVSLACDSLLDYQCSLALAGGVATKAPKKRGYIYEPGSILSPDGHCRAFDARAEGTIFGSGVGLVLLKRLKDAIEDGDVIHAVVRGTAVNNDGSLKVGYTAPSAEGQARVIAMAHAMAGVSPETITYVEAHGTGTSLGDPIEVEALTQAFRAGTDKKGFCALGSVKTNIGHADSAAGIAGFIKTVLALENKMLPPSLNFENPNPSIDFANSPFYVNSKLSEWKGNGAPRRAGVSAFGIGGTNAHAVLEEAPRPGTSGPSRPLQLLVLTAKTGPALDKAASNLASHLELNPDINIADAAYTLAAGRQPFNHRRILVCRDAADAASALAAAEPKRVFSGSVDSNNRSVSFMFPGQGAQYVNMAAELMESEPRFRDQVETCCELLKPQLGIHLRDVLYPADGSSDESSKTLTQTSLAQPALFVIEYSLAKLWMEWGVTPTMMIGHSIGEYVAACLAGVFSLEDALSLVATRGKLMQQLPKGAMLAVPLAESEVQPFLNKRLSLAAVNAPRLCVVSGAIDAVENLNAVLAQKGVECRALHTSHAFHSEMMSPILAPFTELLRRIKMKAPEIPFISNLTGELITDVEAAEPGYWAKHLRQPVRFADGLRRLLSAPRQILLEIGPGRNLSTLARRQADRAAGHTVIDSLPHPDDRASALEHILTSAGKLWLEGVKVDWAGFYGGQRRHRVALPTYPFERSRYWMDLHKQGDVAVPDAARANAGAQSGSKQNIADWFSAPSWKRVPLPFKTPEVGGQNGCILVFTDDCGVGDRLASRLTEIGRDVVSIRPGAGFQKLAEGLYELDPGDSQDYDLLLEDLGNAGKVPANLIHLWSVTPADNASVESAIDRSQELGFYSLLSFVQAFGRKDSANLFIAVVSNSLQEVSGDETLSPEKATVLGPVKVIPQEYPNIKCRSIDIVSTADARLIDQLLAEISSDSPDQVVAYRGSHRWVQIFEPVRLDESSAQSARIVEGGVYLITGGLGGVGLTLAGHLARTAQAKLALIGRSKLPPPLEWDAWLESHPADDGISEKIRKVRELEAMGSEVVVIDANVADREQIERAISETMGSFGKINGVIHSAGVPAGGVIQLKTREMVEAIVAPKLTGTLMLDNALKGVDLDFFLLCSSLASVVGGAGQVDYCGANAFLDVFARRRATSGHGLTVSVNWDAWQEVGMAAEAARENNGMGGAGIGSIAGSKKANHPMFDYRIDGGPGREVFVSVFSAEKHWFLSDHKVTGTATLPGTAYLEMARAALQEHAGESALEIRDAYFLAPLMVAEGEEKEARTVLSKIGEHFEFSIASRTRGDGDSWQEHAKGEIAPIENPPHRSLNVREIEARCGEERRTLKDPELKSHEGFMEFGPRWNNVQRVRYGNGEGIATLELPEPLADDVLSFKLHPALLDSATGFLTIKAQDNSPYLPFSYKRLTQKGPLPEKVYSYARFVDDGGSQHGTLKLDVTITDSEGTALVEIEDYILRKIDIQRVSAEANDAPADWDRKNFDLSLSSPGVLDSLRYVPVERHSPGPGQVEIKVCATALNFKEVLMALGLLGIPTGAGSAFGLECAGKIVSVGKGVSEFEIGDEVIAFARSSFSPYVITSTTWVARKPASLSFEEAATIPVPFLTAYFSLINTGRLNRGERVLIHAAAGGVGLAAVQVATWAGAEIFATAGNDEKRRFLQSLGIEHVMDSRSLTFAEEVMRRTGGEGVNVVLNSLTGEFIAKGLSVLAPYGRFLEIGKRDIYSDAQLGLRVFDKCLVFAAIDISPDTTPGLNSSWAEIARHLNDGVFQPLPHTVFAIDEVSQAFDLMARAGHIGRIVVSLQDEQALKRFIASDAGEDGAGARRWRAASAGKSRVGPGREGRVRSRGIEGQPMDAFAEGILPSEGAIAFNRILSASHPQIIVSPRNFLDFSIKRPIPGKADIAQGVSGYRPSHPRPGLKNDYVAPRNETERLVAEIWQNLLGIEQVGVYDNFFELGGDSLLAAQVIPRLHETFGVNIAVARMFEEPTAAGLAELVSSARWSALSTEPDEPEDDREEGRI